MHSVLATILIILLSAFIKPALACPVMVGTAPGLVQMCHCYNNGYGVDRYWMILAIEDAYNNFATYQWGPVGSGYIHYAYYTYYYWPFNSGKGEQGAIVVSLSWVGGTNTDSNSCDGMAPLTISSTDCFNGMHAPIDLCNTEGENHKHGGYGIDVCLAYNVDPNPHINEPSLPLGTSSDF